MVEIIYYIFILYIIYCVYNLFKFKNKNLPPGPYGRLPILGHLLYLGKHPQEKLKKWGDKYGDIFHCYFGTKLVIVLNNYDTIKKAFLDDNFSSRSQPYIYEEQFKGKGLTYSEGELWKIQRSFAMDTLRKFGMGKFFLEETIINEIKDVFDVLDKTNGEPYNIKCLFSHSLSNIICGFAFGHRFSQNNKEFRYIVSLIEECFDLGTHKSLITLYPILRFIPIKYLGLNYYKFSRNFKVIFDFSKKLVELHENNNLTDEPKDYIDAFLQQSKKDIRKNIKTTFEKDQLITSITNLFIAGTETTSTTLRWAIVFMIENPDVLIKIQKEIDNIKNNSNSFIKFEDKRFLPYTQASIMEIQRCGSIAALGGSTMHLNKNEMTFLSYNIPERTYIAANFYAVNVDERIFKNPYKFDPMRFLDKEGNVKNIAGFIPFSVGKRSCPGESLAKMEMFIFFTNLIKRYDLKINNNEEISSKNYKTGLTRSPSDFKISFIRR